MNRIGKNYLQKLNIKETQEAINIIENLLIKELQERIEFIVVREPIISSEKISTTISSRQGERLINFDGSNDNIIYYIFNQYKY